MKVKVRVLIKLILIKQERVRDKTQLITFQI
jgi:hypothetical protein